MKGGAGLKHVVSVSLGSSRRDHAVEVELLGETVRIERVGTDGDMRRAAELLRTLAGRVDALGLGGIDLYLYDGRRRYTFRQARYLAAAAGRTPLVDGTGLKNTLERRVVQQLARSYPLEGRRVLLVSAVDRFGMARAFTEAGCETIFGDLIFALGLPVPIRSLRTLQRLSRLVLPVLVQLPFRLFYPLGKEQERTVARHGQFYRWADVVAGDFHFIRRYMPERLDGKVIVTNTVTRADVAELRQRGAALLVTTTPELDGRSFGTNVMEAVLVALSGKRPEELTEGDYERLLDAIGFAPRLEPLGNAPIPTLTGFR